LVSTSLTLRLQVLLDGMLDHHLDEGGVMWRQWAVGHAQKYSISLPLDIRHTMSKKSGSSQQAADQRRPMPL
jgi:hypothetical protein